MDTRLEITELLKKGKIQNELEFEQALISDRKLRVLAKKEPEYNIIRKKLKTLIKRYEKVNWIEVETISDQKILESDIAELVAENERVFIQNRKILIRKKLKSVDANQQELGIVLGHKSKSYISELMNGVNAFSLKDLIVIHRLLKIDLTDLVPTFIAHEDRVKIKTSIKLIENPKLKLSKQDFELV